MKTLLDKLACLMEHLQCWWSVYGQTVTDVLLAAILLGLLVFILVGIRLLCAIPISSFAN